MPPKRKRNDEPDSQASVTRRATRQTPVNPPPVLASVSAAAAAAASASASISMLSPPPPPPSAPASETAYNTAVVTGGPLLPEQQKRGVRGRLAAKPPSTTTTTTTTTEIGQDALLPPSSPGTIRVSAPLPARRGAAAADMGSIVVKDNLRPSDLVAPEITYHVPQANHHGRQSSLVRPHGPSAPPPRLDKVHPLPLLMTPVPPPKPPLLPASDRMPPRADRNIDKVVLGNLCFRTWYPSYYGKEVLGDTSGNAKGGSKGVGAKDTGGKAQSKKDKDHQPMLERLYVCPSCFKYAKELVAWWGHVKHCQQRGYMPGQKIYVHPRGRRTVYVAHDSSKGPGPKKRRGDGGIRYVEEVVQDEGEWSIWQVDGEKDVLFCQNLSLFAKLFLDNKSVFFDVTGFHYFLLVYTPPPSSATANTSGDVDVAPQITGFFSKEKMSWDNNNLACILVFPPWQRKGLGALLMGASYEISRREGIMGGPEKPISDLGKKGYRRFWSGEIARWLLGLDTGQDGAETIVDVEDCSQATWISAEDCLVVLREMGIVEDAGMGPGKPETAEEPQPQLQLQLADEDKKKKQGGGEEEGKQQQQQQQQSGRGGTGAGEAEEDKLKAKKANRETVVARVRVDKEAVRRYVATHKIPLDKACDVDGFVEGYDMKTREEAKAQSEEEEAEAGDEAQG